LPVFLPIMTKGLIGRKTGNTNDQRIDREKNRQYE
jgi:hypothetical protein